MKYTVRDFNEQFKDDKDCLAFLFQQRFPHGIRCEKCSTKDQFYPVAKRRSYACSCGHQIYPTEGTIFHKSSTSLKLWFFAMFLMTASKNGVSAKELQRQLGVTYKCAWRMAHQIRLLMGGDGEPLKGIVEADETYIGGKRPGKRGRGAAGKTPVVGVLQRGGGIVAKAATDVTRQTILPHIQENVKKGSLVVTDEFSPYKSLPRAGYKHEVVQHGKREYVRGKFHTNSIEGFWSQLKRSINGTFYHVSQKHLQSYVNEFAYRYNLRKSEIPIFGQLMEQASLRL